jgi:hypothetical protein
MEPIRRSTRSAFEQLRAFFHPYDYAAALEAEPSNVLRVYVGAIDHVLDVKQNVGQETGWQRFPGMVKRLASALSWLNSMTSATLFLRSQKESRNR